MTEAVGLVEPIDEGQQQRVVALTQDYVTRAESIFERKFAPVDVLFDLSGSSAGMFKVIGKDCIIRYNPWLFAKYYEENLSGTVPHEVAHYIVHRLYGMRRVRPHGREWLALMTAFQADPSVTCNFDMTGIPRRRQRRYSYRCACRIHQLSARRHNAIVRGKGRYQCLQCKGELLNNC